jgi:hypothetical protein
VGGKDNGVNIKTWVCLIFASFVLSVVWPPLYALEEKKDVKTGAPDVASELVGTWEIVRTKEPGKPYAEGYKGRPFVSKGANAFTLILEYRKDGTFRRISRVGDNETVQQGTWVLAGHELRHRRAGAQREEVMYIRFDGPNQYTSLEVFEDTPDPGLFAQFRRVR